MELAKQIASNIARAEDVGLSDRKNLLQILKNDIAQLQEPIDTFKKTKDERAMIDVMLKTARQVKIGK